MSTHPGLVRQGNEDACAVSVESGAYIVCDGMGGAAAGEVASRLACDVFLAYLAQPLIEGLSPTPQALLNGAIHAANHVIFKQASKSPDHSGMGTTLVALLHVPDATPPLFLAHVGDSRCYLYRDRSLYQLTDDHSLVEEQVRAGQITADEAARSPMRNFITRAVGSQATVDIDIQALQTQPGDLYLLASDGLNRELSDADIDTVLADVPSPPTQPYLAAACNALIKAANHHGGHDNITVLILAFPNGIERRNNSRLTESSPH